MDETAFDLRRLLHPIAADVFKREYWEQQPLLVRRQTPNYYRGLLALTDVDRILAASSISSPLVRILREGHDVPLDAGAGGLSGTARRLESLYAHYRRGATVVLQFLNERWQPLTTLCRNLAVEFSAAFQVNAYLTPAGERGLNSHYDTHDVFVVQTEGTKHWRVYEPTPVRLPLRGQPYDSRAMKPGALWQEFDLQPGDLLYLPRGWMHDAVSQDAASLHLTIGVNTITWASVVLGAVESVIERDSRFRESLPPEFATDATTRRAAQAQLADLLDGLVKQIDPVSVIENSVTQALVAVQPELGGHLLDLEALPHMTVETRVRRRPGMQWTLTTAEATTTLSFHGKTIQMPDYVEADLRFIGGCAEFTVADLPGDLDDSGKLVLVRALTREGFLTIVADGGSMAASP